MPFWSHDVIIRFPEFRGHFAETGDPINMFDLTMLAYSALLSGAYASRIDRELPEQYTGPDADARLSVLKAVAMETEATPNQVILAWMHQSKPTIIPLVAASTLEQMQENLDALAVKLTDEQITRLTTASA